VILSLDDAILRLKAEIIAQDWRLSPKRIEQLEAAFTSLGEPFKGRKAPHAMLVMATNVLGYIKKRGPSPPETIDFLKEAMAHLVNLHEDLTDDPGREEEILQSLFARFTTLKEKIQQKSLPPALPEPGPWPEAISEPGDEEEEAPAAVGLQQLITEFKRGLVQAGPSGVALKVLVEEWLLSPAVAAIIQGGSGEEGAGSVPLPSLPEGESRPCPPTPVRILTTSGLAVAIPSSVIALVRPVPPAKATAYLQNAVVPVKDFSRFLQRLSRQFSGSLALVKERTLKELSLPIMTPEGQGFREAPDSTFTTLVVVSNGNWHGALVCDEIREGEQIMTQVVRQPNGDLVGTARLEDGGRIPLLDPVAMLRREGILLMR